MIVFFCQKLQREGIMKFVEWHFKQLHSVSFLVSNCKTSVNVVLVFANHYKQTKRGYIYVLDICIIYRITQKLFLNEEEIFAINIAVSLYMYYITDGMCMVQYMASR